jgi:hypothetical protein
VLADQDLDRLEAERFEQFGAGLHPRRDHDGVQGQVTAAGQHDPGEAASVGFDLFDLAFRDGDPEGLQQGPLLGVRRRTGVPQQRHVRAELLEQQGLVDGGRPGGQDSYPLVPDLPAVTVRAVQHVDPPPGGQPGHVGQHVAQAGGGQQPPGGHRARAGLGADLDAEPLAVPAQSGDPAGLDLAAVPPHLGAPGREELGRRRAVPAEEVVHVSGWGVARVARVDDQDRAAGPGQRDRAAQPGRPAADHHDVVVLVLVHALTIAPNPAI